MEGGSKMLENVIAEYKKKLSSAERQQILSDVRIHLSQSLDSGLYPWKNPTIS